jgi:hypothetical protein
MVSKMVWPTYDGPVGPQNKSVILKAAPPAMDVVEFARVRLGFEADPKQAAALRSGPKRGMLLCTRQWGQSSTGAVMAVEPAYTRPGSLVLVATPGDRQSSEFLRKAWDLARKLKMPLGGDGDNETSLLFPNGSRIVGLPGTEAARVTGAMYRALQPMLAVGNVDIWLMSTPWGKSGFFYETWAHGGDNWMRVSVPATECPRIPAEFFGTCVGGDGDGFRAGVCAVSWTAARERSSGIWWRGVEPLGI